MLQMRSPLSPPKSAGYNPLSAAKSLFGSPSKQGGAGGAAALGDECSELETWGCDCSSCTRRRKRALPADFSWSGGPKQLLVLSL